MYKIYTIPMNVSFPHMLRDSGSRENDIVMERYFNDMYVLFSNKLTSYILQGEKDSVTADHLRAMLEEIIKVRRLLNKEDNQKSDTIE